MKQIAIWWRRRGGSLFIVALIFMVLLFFSGGASRGDAQSQLLIRIVSIVAGAVALVGISRSNLARVRAPLIFIALAALSVAVQLIPLPPALWFGLPGRLAFDELARLANVADVWRPISLTPDLTVSSLLALLPAAATILLFARLPGRDSRRLLVPLIVLVMVSGLVGLLQLSSGMRSLYLYRITNVGTAVGLFANRNHQGVLLAMVLPMLAVFAALRNRTGSEVWKFWLAIGLSVFVIPLILVTGSRAALILALIGIAAGWLLHGPGQPTAAKRAAVQNGLVPALLWVGGVALVGIAAVSSRALAIQRLFSEDVTQEIRLKLFTPMVDIGLIYFPVGAGFGSFVDVFKMHEPLDNLDIIYLNHAHNELLELFIEGGLPALVLVGAFLAWWAWRALALWTHTPPGDTRLFARLGTILTAMAMIASLADYPLRTPIMGAIFAIGLCWMAAQRPRHSEPN